MAKKSENGDKWLNGSKMVIQGGQKWAKIQKVKKELKSTPKGQKEPTE